MTMLELSAEEAFTTRYCSAYGCRQEASRMVVGPTFARLCNEHRQAEARKEVRNQQQLKALTLIEQAEKIVQALQNVREAEDQLNQANAQLENVLSTIP